MTAATAPAGGGALERRTSTSLADVVDTILDKGLVIDAYVGVSLVGIELLTVDARVVVASVDTYLRYADEVNRLDLRRTGGTGLPELVEGVTGAKTKGKAKGVVEAAGEALRDFAADRVDQREPSSRRRA